MGLSVTTSALMAGLFYAYSCSVSPGLGQLSDQAYIAAMQAINRAIQNPIFLGSFFGAPFFLVLNSWGCYYQPQPVSFWLSAAATGLYLVGILGVTALGNVPLNDTLDAFDWQTASPQMLAEQRLQFKQAWNSFNTIRTVCATGTVILLISSLIVKP